MRSEKLKKTGEYFFFLLLTAHFLTASLGLAATPPDLEEQSRAIAAELRCPVCQNLSVADSPSEMAQQMRALVQEQIKQGKSSEEIKNFFVSKYGDWVLLAPPARGFSLLLWVLPGVVAVLGVIFVVLWMRHSMKKKKGPPPADEARQGVEGQRGHFLGEQERLETEAQELEFDFQSGKLSEADYRGLRGDLQAQEDAVKKRLEAVPAERPRSAVPAPAKKAASEPLAPRRWPLVAGGVFLLLFGLALGVLLTQSLRPRGSAQDSITGDFLTGTQPAGGESLLAQGRKAFEQGQWAQSIELFKKVLASDPNNPEAHAYMGLILAQAGHTDGALLAFDRALAAAPDLAPALWGKGMVLSQSGGDPAEARRLLQKVSGMMPPGADKDEVEKTIAQLGKDGKKKPTNAQATAAGGAEIQGTVDIDPKAQGKIDGQAILFIIAKSTSSAGAPPLAVKRIAKPKFPMPYSLSAQDVMMPGTPFSGRVFVSARLDQDGNPSTKEPGNLAGEYKKNPVDVGGKKIDILLDQAR